MRTVLNAIFGLQTLPPIHGDRTLTKAINSIVSGITIAKCYDQLQGCRLGVERLILDRYPYSHVADYVNMLNTMIEQKEATIQGGYEV